MSDFYIFRNALKDLFRVKNLIAVTLVALLPLGIALLWRSLAPASQFVNADVYDRLSETVIFGFVLVILACVFGTGLVSQEVEQKTIVYLLTRPVPRWRILLMKHAAAFLATTLVAWVASALLLLGTGGIHAGAKAHIGRDLLILPVGSLAYGGLFLLMTTLFRRPLILGLVYTFGIESWLPGLPGNFKMLSLMAWLRVLAPHAQPGAADDIASGDILTPRLAWIVVTAVIVVTTACALAIFSTNEYVPRDDA
jgi:ABC-2 type transport system permease protein